MEVRVSTVQENVVVLKFCIVCIPKKGRPTGRPMTDWRRTVKHLGLENGLSMDGAEKKNSLKTAKDGIVFSRISGQTDLRVHLQ